MQWKEIVKEAMKNLGGSANLSQLYEETKKVAKKKDPEKFKTNKNIEAKVRQTVQLSGLFYQKVKGSGIWFEKENDGARYICPNGCDAVFHQKLRKTEIWSVDKDGTWIDDLEIEDSEILETKCEKCGKKVKEK